MNILYLNVSGNRTMTEVKFYDCSYEPSAALIYSVISARYKNNWIYVRHHERTTFEIPGGHIEAGETSLDAAKRELMEETGALEFSIDCVATYSVTKEGKTGWGRLYYAEVTKIGPVPDISEIAQVLFSGHFTEHNTHPDIQPHLFKKVLEYLHE